MGFAGGKIFLAILFWLLALALFFQALGLVVDFWWGVSFESSATIGEVSANGGLWAVCVLPSTQTYKTCFTYEAISDLEGWFVAVRALAIGGVCLLFLAITCCFSAAISSGGKMWRLITAILCFLAFFVIITEWAVFVAKIENDGWRSLDMWPPEDNLPTSEFAFYVAVDHINYYASFVVTIVANVLSLVCGILAIVSWRANDVTPIY